MASIPEVTHIIKKERGRELPIPWQQCRFIRRSSLLIKAIMNEKIKRYQIPERYIIKRRPYPHTRWRELKKTLWITKKIYGERMGLAKNREQESVYGNYERVYAVPNDVWEKEHAEKQYEIFYGNEAFVVSGLHCYAIRIEIIYDWIRKLGAKKILEVGSGRGKNLVALLRHDPNLDLKGLERSSEGVERSREWGTKINFIQGDARKLPFADNSFDVAFTNQVLEQMPYDYGEVVREMKRVARHCIFIEEFKEDQRLSDWLWVRHKDFFRESYKTLAENPIYFSSDIPRSKSKYGLGLLVIHGGSSK